MAKTIKGEGTPEVLKNFGQLQIEGFQSLRQTFLKNSAQYVVVSWIIDALESGSLKDVRAIERYCMFVPDQIFATLKEGKCDISFIQKVGEALDIDDTLIEQVVNARKGEINTRFLGTTPILVKGPATEAFYGYLSAIMQQYSKQNQRGLPYAERVFIGAGIQTFGVKSEDILSGKLELNQSHLDSILSEISRLSGKAEGWLDKKPDLIASTLFAQQRPIMSSDGRNIAGVPANVQDMTVREGLNQLLEASIAERSAAKIDAALQKTGAVGRLNQQRAAENAGKSGKSAGAGRK
ncbi:MAG: hypothetical protein K2Q12_11530 [Rickettsiales bacterium]|nr:hypothetical protein [Rickettsiales bacterium]